MDRMWSVGWIVSVVFSPVPRPGWRALKGPRRLSEMVDLDIDVTGLVPFPSPTVLGSGTWESRHEWL